jgi:hypothetical protein
MRIRRSVKIQMSQEVRPYNQRCCAGAGARGAEEYAQLLAALPPGTEPSPTLGEIRWMIEELRASRYAHPMRTRYPVSVKRI